MTLEVLICTIDRRIQNVPDILQAQRPDVSYLVAWQHTSPDDGRTLPPALQERHDVRVIHVQGGGLARNRNAALEAAQGNLLLIADDDVTYFDNSFDEIVQAFRTQDADIICFQALGQEGRLLKTYSAVAFDYANQPRGTYFTSFEIAMRRSPRLPRFDERFGLGAPYLGAGEEEVFLLQAHHAGLRVRYLPMTIVRTKSQTTGSRYPHEPVLWRTKGAVLCLKHGRLGATLRSLKDALTRRGLHNRLRVFHEMQQGIGYIENDD